LSSTPATLQQRTLRTLFQQGYRTRDLIVQSPSMRRLFDIASRAARSTATVLIQGESGTGKERLARFVHDQSDRARAPFIGVNCKAFAPGVLESELFGHRQGAFTGATRDHQGVFEQARGGTLLLDEIGDIDDTFQAKLLRVLQEGEIQPVGATRRIPVDVRVIAAPHRDLNKSVREGQFREDLFYRLSVIPLNVPPLRERCDEILPLAKHFFKRYTHQLSKPLEGWTREVERHLLTHTWPGNVRELENTLERACVLAQDKHIEISDLLLEDPLLPSNAPEATLQDTLNTATIQAIRSAMARAEGHRQEAARLLGIERSTLYRLIKKHGLQ